jgi:hypothetical protein
MEPLGLYNLVERVDEDYLEIRIEKGDWTIIKGGDATAGSQEAWEELEELARQGGSGDAGSLAALKEQVDLIDFSRFVIVNLWLGSPDLGIHWYARRPRDDTAPWRFLCWDGDRIGLVDAAGSFRQKLLPSPGDLSSVLLKDVAFQELFLTELRQAKRGLPARRAWRASTRMPRAAST